MSKYNGITYNQKWKPNCKEGEHLFDEVWSSSSHYLHCDICGLEVHIQEIKKPEQQEDEE